MSQQQQTGYYDKLLYYLNRTFVILSIIKAINYRSLELYLDLTKQERKIRFKSIKNIYSTLTEGKADEVIYEKNKSQLSTNHIYNQLQATQQHRYTKRTCWRMMEKLISKIAHYLSNEHRLQQITPNIIKFISFTRIAGDKINNKASFIQFFRQVLDLIIIENNMLQKRIYEMLISSGYISSIDEFYRMNRFQGPNLDFVYSSIKKQQPIYQQKHKQQLNIQLMESLNSKRSKRSQSKIGDLKLTHKFINKLQTFNNIYDKNIPQEQSKQSLQSSIDINEDNDSQGQQPVQLELEEVQQDKEQKNRVNHIVHQQVEKTVDQLLKNLDFKVYMESYRQEDHINTPSQSARKKPKNKKQPIIKQILKNLHLKKFKTNQKLITIDKNLAQTQKQYKKPLAIKSKIRKHKNRVSIVTAISNRMKQNLFETQHINQFQDMIYKKLSNLQSSYSTEKQLRQNQATNLIRTTNKKFTQNILHQTRPKYKRHEKHNPYEKYNKNKNKDQDDELYDQEDKYDNKNIIHSGASFNPSEQNYKISNFHFNNHKNHHNTSNKSMKSSKQQCTNNQIKLMRRDSNFIDSIKSFDIKNKGLKQKRFINPVLAAKAEDFNSAILGITAKKYNKYGQNIDEMFSNNKIQQTNLCQRLIPHRRQHTKVHTQQNEPQRYHHNRKFQVYDRFWRRFI